jgi:hypothetical protein
VTQLPHMENVLLVQKTVIGKNEFTLEKDCIHARQKKNGEKWEFRMPYEQIGFDTVRKSDNQLKYALYICAPLAVMFVIALVSSVIVGRNKPVELLLFVFGIAFFTFFAMKSWVGRNIEYIYLQVGQKRIEMFSNVPDEQAVQNFIEEIHTRIRAKHKENFFKQPDSIPLEIRIRQLNGLIAINAITEAERDDYLRKDLTRNVPLN